MPTADENIAQVVAAFQAGREGLERSMRDYANFAHQWQAKYESLMATCVAQVAQAYESGFNAGVVRGRGYR